MRQQTNRRTWHNINNTKLILGCLLLLLVQLCGLSSGYGWNPEKLYHYEFEASIASRIASDPKSQSAGVIIKTPISLALKDKGGSSSVDDELTIRLDQPQWSTYNGVPESDKLEFKQMDQSLMSAFRMFFDAKDGQAKSFEVSFGEPLWVRNFKRGLLSLFQLQLKGNQQSESFTTAEKSVFGDCETEYVVIVNEPGEHQSGGTLNVTKSRNMAKCKSRWSHRYSPIDSMECYENEKDSQSYKSSNALFNYNLVGTRDSFIIEEASLDESYISSPFGPKSYTSQVDTRFQLRLVNSESNPSSINIPGSNQVTLSLAYEPAEVINFYANVDLTREHHLANIFQLNVGLTESLKAIDEFAKEHKSYTNAGEGSAPDLGPNYQENSPMAALFMRATELVSALNYQNLEQLYYSIEERGDVHKRIFWDIMSATGTNPSFIFMKKLITEGDAPTIKVKGYLTRLSFHIKSPSKSLFDEYVNLCKSDKIQSNKEYKKLCLLPLASLINQHCVKPHARYMRIQAEGGNVTSQKRGQNTCQIATADEYFSRLVQTFTPSANPASGESSDGLTIGDKMFNVKMAGELGVKPSVEFLKEVAKVKSEHPTVRASALWNMMKAGSVYPSLVKRISLPYYYDPKESLEVRIAGFFNFLASGPSYNEMRTLAKKLESEPNRQLVLYIHSLVKSMASMEWPECGACGSNQKMGRLILPIIKKAIAGHPAGSLGDSHVHIGANWLNEYGYGTWKLYSAIYGDESFTPSNLFYMDSEVMAGGIKVNPITICVQAHGLDKLVKRVVGINGLLSDKESFMDVFSKRRSRRQAAVGEIIKQEAQEIDKELKLATREFSDVYIAITVSYYGRPIMFMDRDSRELKKLVSDDGTIKIPHIKKLLHSFNNHTSLSMMLGVERFEMLNNELGFPIVQSMTEFEHKQFKLNTIKFDVEPGFFKDERQGKPPSRITIGVDAKSSRHQEFLGTTGIVLTPKKQQLGVLFHKKRILNMPIKINVDVNLAEQKVQVKRQPIHENILFVRHKPATFDRDYDPNHLMKIDVKSLYNVSEPTQMKDFKMDYMTPLAIGLKAEGKHKAGFDLALTTLQRHMSAVGMGAAQFLLKYAPSGSPLELRLSTITTQENPTKELTTEFMWRHYHESEVQSSLDKELEQYVASHSSAQEAGDRKPATVHYGISLMGGSTKERKVAISLAYSRSWDRALHKWLLSYQRTPLNQAGDASSPYSEATNLCWNGELQFSKYDISRWLKMDLLNLQHSANLTSDLTFGDHCGLDSGKQAESNKQARLALDAKFDWSQEQRDLYRAILSENRALMNADNAGMGRQIASLYDKCQEQRSKNKIQLDPNCLQFLLKSSELTHIKSTIDYQQVPARWSRILNKLGSWYTLARSSYMESNTEDPSSYGSCDSDPNKLHRAQLEANMTSQSERKLSYEIQGQGMHVLYKNIPFSLPPISTFPLAGGSYYQMVRRQAGHRFCSVGSNSVTTFDNLTYTMPPINDGCFKLIAKDCSPENNFVVLGAAVGSGKVVKIYVANKYKVEFVPDKEGKSVSEIKLNGDSIRVEPEKAPIRQTTKIGPNSQEAFSIENNGAYYTLNSKLYRFSVSTDGTWIFVQQSKYYAGKSCGICGDANGNQLLEFKSPSLKVCKNSDDFVWSHVLPSTCASRPRNVEC